MDIKDFVPLCIEDVPTVVQTLLESPSDLLICGRNRKKCVLVLDHLAVDLCSDIKIARKLKQDLKSDKINFTEAFTEILNDWLRGLDGNKASFEELISVLDSNMLPISADKAKRLLCNFVLPKREEVLKSDDDGGDAENISAEMEEEEDDPDPSTINVASSTTALSNSVILEEIFQKLSMYDSRNFRLVNSLWWKESLSFWRKSTRVRIINGDGNSPDEERFYAHLPLKRDQPSISLKSYVELLQNGGEPNISGNDTDDRRSRYKLLDPPHRSYNFFYNAFLHKEQTENLEFERIFWKTCGPTIEHLKLSYVRYDYNSRRIFFKIFKKLVLGVAPNLKELEIDGTCREANWLPESDDVPWETEEYPTGKLAENLESLILEADMNDEDTAKILRMCPNLKSLSVGGVNNPQGISEPAGNGEYIKLEKLKIRFGGISNHTFLRDYVQLSPESLKHLELTQIRFNSNRRQPDLWAALVQCRNLQSLQLDLHQQFEEDEEEFRRWFMDISLLSFPNLLKFKYRTMYYLFDFGAVKGMPKLEELDIEYIPFLFNKRAYPHEWLYMGEREQFAPLGVPTSDYLYSEEEPIVCENLKKFSFIGWDMTDQDVHRISKWFPNLAALSATISSESLTTAVESWGKLEKLEIHTKEFIYLSQMRPLKEINKNLKIILHFNILNDRFTSQQSMEVMEDEQNNGRLFFGRYGADKYMEYDYYGDDEDDENEDD